MLLQGYVVFWIHNFDPICIRILKSAGITIVVTKEILILVHENPNIPMIIQILMERDALEKLPWFQIIPFVELEWLMEQKLEPLECWMEELTIELKAYLCNMPLISKYSRPS